MKHLRALAKPRIIFTWLVLILSPTALSQEVWIRGASLLLAEPKKDSAAQGLAKPDAKAIIRQRKGIWVRVQTGDSSGWVRLSAIRYASPGVSIKTSLSALKTGREGSGNNVAATGVRGMDANMLTGAKPNFKELALLDALRTDSAFTKELQEIKNRREIPEVRYRRSAEKGPASSESSRPGMTRIKERRSELEDDF